MQEITTKVQTYLKNKFIENDSYWVSQEELLNEFSELKTAKTTSHDKCVKLWAIINELNAKSEEIYLIRNNAYKVATEEEAIAYCENYFNNKIAPSLKRYWRIKKKIVKDGEGSVFDAEKFVNVFMKGVENETQSN